MLNKHYVQEQTKPPLTYTNIIKTICLLYKYRERNKMSRSYHLTEVELCRCCSTWRERKVGAIARDIEPGLRVKQPQSLICPQSVTLNHQLLFLVREVALFLFQPRSYPAKARSYPVPCILHAPPLREHNIINILVFRGVALEEVSIVCQYSRILISACCNSLADKVVTKTE